MEFVEKPNFTKVIQRFPDSDYAAFQRDLAFHPEQGDLVRGTGGFRKARMGGERGLFTFMYRNRTQFTS